MAFDGALFNKALPAEAANVAFHLRIVALVSKAREIILLVWKLDGLGRSLAHLVRLLKDLRAYGVELVSFSEGIDFSTATGKLMCQMVSAFVEFERDAIRERVCPVQHYLFGQSTAAWLFP